jgi:hypothetical protein
MEDETSIEDSQEEEIENPLTKKTRNKEDETTPKKNEEVVGAFISPSFIVVVVPIRATFIPARGNPTATFPTPTPTSADVKPNLVPLSKLAYLC